ncbi:hypothetical protein [Flavobacterium nackdongense]|uniref:Uncharacterized protein n=1 Tax=Flavobacterium nackdongense TaxID=2547394 RepID=A0A4P6Y8U6_9FLAO|nr:hypothetical protein [Flavobacterium nackdongense]QBN19299.1 hypothetical protein E1750_10960 [Flavobacterium nackdongense]
MQASLKQPFTNVQLELLKTFSHQLPESDLIDLKNTLALFFAKRLINQADTVWEEKEWNDKLVDEMLHTKMRKSK